MRKSCALIIFANLALPVCAQTKPVVAGEPSVSIEGSSAANSGSVTGGNAVISGGSSNVIINGKPAATVGDQTDCGGTVVTGSSSVFINGKPMATSGSAVTDCPK